MSEILAQIRSNRRRIVHLFLLYFILQAVFLWAAWTFLEPQGYYGPPEAPRFADPWIARTETILNGGQLYKDVFTTTPPLTNYILVPPSWFALRTGMVNPQATTGFMVYFSLFNLFTAWLLLFMFKDNSELGYISAIAFLLNPLTFGNTILRRQDESIIVFFLATSLFFLLRNQHSRAAIAIGLSMLVKLTGVIPLPLAFWHNKKWQYIFLPVAAFFIGLAPWLLSVGRAAMFWDVNTRDNQHPFQFDGVSLGRLWNKWSLSTGGDELDLLIPSAIFIVGVVSVILFVMWQRYGLLEDITLVATAVLVLSPKLHTGYFSILVLFMTPLVVKKRLLWPFIAFGFIALLADYYKWPAEDFQLAFGLMVAALVLLIGIVLRLMTKPDIPDQSTKYQFKEWEWLLGAKS